MAGWLGGWLSVAADFNGEAALSGDDDAGTPDSDGEGGRDQILYSIRTLQRTAQDAWETVTQGLLRDSS